MEADNDRRIFTRRDEEPERGGLDWKFWLIMAGLALILAGTFTAVWWHEAGKRRACEALEEAVAEAKALGFPVADAELEASRPYVPGDKDAAGFYEEAFRLLQAARDGGLNMIPQDAPIVGRGQAPGDPREPLPEKMLAASRAHLGELAEVFSLLQKGAGCEGCRYTIMWDGAATLLPHLSSARHCVRLLTLAAWVTAEDGDAGEALERISEGLTLSRSLDGEPIVVSQLVGFVSRSMVAGNLERVLARVELDDAQLARLQRELEAAAESINAKTAVGGEIVTVAGIARRLHERDEGWDDILQNISSTDLSAPELRALARRSAQAAPESIRQLIEVADMAEDSTPETLRRLDEIGGHVKNPYEWTPLEGAPYAARMVLQGESTRAKLMAAGAGVAALRFRRGEGRWPEGLEELVPEYIDAAPVDPFTGEALLYRVVEGGVIIYSVNLNFTDDGGRPWLVTPEEGKDRAQWKGDYDDVGFRGWERRGDGR